MASTISIEKARVIASEWHGGQMTGLYSLASWPGIVPDNSIIKAAREVERELDTEAPTNVTERLRLEQLQRYLLTDAKRRGLSL